MTNSLQPQSRWQAAAELAGRGILYGLGAAAVGAGLGYALGRGLPGALAGLNWAGIVLCLLAGLMIKGSFDTSAAEAAGRGRLGQGTRRAELPFAPMLLALVAGGVCFVLAWLFNNLA
ncbi:hypothetical protein [Deinococcus puniceus]|uniref:Uncharacterized protein n=1 Tax=Deinococcus puniceus TaxID=1182568 RepID=A0A172TAS9_9DEIO|nr:hypothetical protein [Deinococcus puniceus]ANE44027.1 hypothetical protein SU48_09830 [Deinococcus puniceus]